jgi:hypothetical protein
MNAKQREKFARKGKRAPVIAVMEQAGVHIALGRAHQGPLAQYGWLPRVALGDPESFQLQPFGRCIFLASANWRRGDSSLLSGDGSKVFVRLTLFVAAPTSATL